MSVLKDMGFKINPYHMCVAKKMTDGKQCTISWYVDDNKILHVKQEVVDSLISTIRNKFRGSMISKGDDRNFL